MIVYIKNLKESSEKAMSTFKCFCQVAGCKQQTNKNLNEQKPAPYSAVSNLQNS